MPLLILFILVPVIEIALFIQVGDQIGLFWTIATVIITAVIGTYLVRSQGLRALNRAQSSLAQQKLPLEEVFTGLCLLVAGALLLTPGFLTDTIGFILLAPPLRKAIGMKVLAYLKSRGSVQFGANGFQNGGFQNGGFQNGGFQAGGDFDFTRQGRPRGREDVIDGDYEVVQDNPNEGSQPDDSPWKKDQSPRLGQEGNDISGDNASDHKKDG